MWTKESYKHDFNMFFSICKLAFFIFSHCKLAQHKASWSYKNQSRQKMVKETATTRNGKQRLTIYHPKKIVM